MLISARPPGQVAATIVVSGIPDTVPIAAARAMLATSNIMVDRTAPTMTRGALRMGSRSNRSPSAAPMSNWPRIRKMSGRPDSSISFTVNRPAKPHAPSIHALVTPSRLSR